MLALRTAACSGALRSTMPYGPAHAGSGPGSPRIRRSQHRGGPRRRHEIAEAYFREHWITASGTLDPGKFPIEPILQQTLQPSLETFRSGCILLGSMVSHGRMDAGVCLLGLLRYYEHDLGRLEVIVETLGAFRKDACATALFHELRRVKGSNATRRYLDRVIATLTHFPVHMVGEGFRALAADPSFSHRMRTKFARAIESMESEL